MISQSCVKVYNEQVDFDVNSLHEESDAIQALREAGAVLSVGGCDQARKVLYMNGATTVKI